MFIAVLVFVADALAFDEASRILRGVSRVGPVEALSLIVLAFGCVFATVRLIDKVLDLLRGEPRSSNRRKNSKEPGSQE